MTRLRNKAVISLTIVGLLAMSGIAMASSHQEEKNDTVFNYGYDQENQFLLWNISSLDYQVDEETLAEALFENYSALFMACALAPADGVVPLFDGYSFSEGTVTLTLGTEPAELPEGCNPAMFGGVVTGPNGQVNHGMFMKLFNSLYQGQGKGCLVRHLAQSQLGKDDQKVQASQDYVAPEDPIAIEAGTVVFTSEDADCIHGKKAKDGDESNRGGPPEHVLLKQAEKWGADGKPGKGPKN